MRIHAREQDIQRKVNVALARAKRAEGLVSALRHENSSLRAKLKMLEQENGLNPSLAATIETPKTKTRRVNMLKGDPSSSIDTPPTQRGGFVARKMQQKEKEQSHSNSMSTTRNQGNTQTNTSQLIKPTPTHGVSFLNVISSDLPRVSGSSLAKTKIYGKRKPLREHNTNVEATTEGLSDVQTIEL